MNDDVVLPAFLDPSPPAGGVTWQFQLPDADLRRSPEWNPSQKRIPLPIDVAVQKAVQAIQRVPINTGLNLPTFGSGYRWAGPYRIELLSLWLVANATFSKPKQVWFYKVYFSPERTSNLMSGHGEMSARGEVIVLLTGKTFLPQQAKR